MAPVARKLPLYLDAHAAFPLLPEAAAAMAPFLAPDSLLFANPQSTLHRPGQQAATTIEKTRRQIALLLGQQFQPQDIILTSGGTESLHLAFRLSLALAKTSENSSSNSPVQAITFAAEHQATLDHLYHLEATNQLALHTLPCDPQGFYNPDLLHQTLSELRQRGMERLVVACLWASNEVGTIQPLQALAQVCAHHRAILVLDAIQAAGWIALEDELPGTVLLCISSLKLGGPAGAGAVALHLPLPKPNPFQKLLGPERNRQAQLRPGTLPTMILAGFGAAAETFQKHRAVWTSQMVTLRATLLSELNRVLGPQQFRCIHIQGPALSDLNLSPIPATPPSIPSLHRLPNNLNLGIEGVPGQELYGALAGKIATSPASACRSGQTGGSHVLQAMGIPSERAHATLRLGLHPRLSRDDMITAAEILGQAIRQSSRF